MIARNNLLSQRKFSIPIKSAAWFSAFLPARMREFESRAADGTLPQVQRNENETQARFDLLLARRTSPT
jgi:hypothetical protein